ncbi:hypothetical protein AALF16_00900 [Bacillus cereus]|uniref:hypothetical protein n=1 Tax=Bacillus cereus TaxID=1396 RepID=UPI00356C6A70
MTYICPVCGYDGLEEQAYDEDGDSSYEICFCCGFEYGFDDLDQGYSFEQYRQEWVEQGMCFSSFLFAKLSTLFFNRGNSKRACP